MSDFTHFIATIDIPGHEFPLYGEISEKSLLMLANNGTDPSSDKHREELKQEAERIGSALKAGQIAATKTATIKPLTKEEYDRTH